MSSGQMNPQDTPSQFKPVSWIDSQQAAWGFILAYLVMAFLMVILAGFLRPRTGESLFIEMGIGAALVGYALLILQVVMGSRLPCIDRPFGHDAVTQFHKKMALTACGFLLLHPILLSLGRDDLPSEDHPFTISSSPTQEGFLTATIKESGNYTRTIGRTTTRHRARIEGPFGRFSLVYHPERPACG